MRRLLLLLLCLPVAAPAEEPSTPDSAAVSLTDLALAADLVALAQVRDTDYRRQREIPVSGSAFLEILIAYKSGRRSDVVEVYEKGLHANECYFPDRTVFEEGRRYLLFLRRDPEEPERYRGLPQGCALEILVTQDNRYALRYPPSGVRLDDPLEELARPMNFADRYAQVADETLPPAERNALLDAGRIEPAGDGYWRYTWGVDLSDLRRLIDPAALSD